MGYREYYERNYLAPTFTKLPPAHLQTKRRRRLPKPKSIRFWSIPMPPERNALLDATPQIEYLPFAVLPLLMMLLQQPRRTYRSQSGIAGCGRRAHRRSLCVLEAMTSAASSESEVSPSGRRAR